MTGSLKILVVSTECVPFAKSGGLGDVTGALPGFLQKLGHNVIVVIPMYSFIDVKQNEINIAIERMNVKMGNELIVCSVHKTTMHEKVPVCFIDYEPYFSNTASVLTIHNIAYQGRYDRYYCDYTGLGEEDFTPDKFECFNAINFLKGGIHFADMVNTVSKGYASETKTSSGGYGLDSFLVKKGDDYIGILNGVDYSEWDPVKDTFIPANYSFSDIKGKSECKRALQEQLGFKQVAKSPVIGIISRLVELKGFYILSECIEDIINNMDVQFAILGSGDNQLETFYGNLQQRYPGKAASFIGYNNKLAHLIEAGSDFFLMPSLSEPCGLNQIYSLKYGTLPIVRATGGLNDTIENYNQDTGEGTGFKFWEPSAKAIYNTVYWALDTYHNRKPHLQKLIRKAMKQNFSWEKSSIEYIKLYQKALENKKTR